MTAEEISSLTRLDLGKMASAKNGEGMRYLSRFNYWRTCRAAHANLTRFHYVLHGVRAGGENTFPVVSNAPEINKSPIRPRRC